MTATTATRTVEGVEVPAPGVYAIDASHTHVGFGVRHLMVSKVRGSFSGVTGTVTIADEPLASWTEVVVDLASIDTRDGKRDEHLRSADFFDVEHYPTMTFRSTGVEKGKGDRWLLKGDLTLHGVTRPIQLEATYEGSATSPWGTTSIGFSATGKVNREDFDLGWNQVLEAGGVVVGKEIALEIEVEAIQS